MSISEDYLELLDHLGRTVPVRTLHADPDAPNLVALRHDVDHDLRVALEMAAIEHERGIRATYCLLHTHPYWRDPNFIRRCLQLQAYGHEVALHLNLLTSWIDDPASGTNGFAAEVRALLAPLRDAGVLIDGVSAHGDRACYEHGFVNYWIWRELRAEDPAAAERGKSAEGIAVDDERWQVAYPPDHRITAPDGRTLDLWCESMNDCGLAYDAVHVGCDRYWTDSGGRWDRRGDPREHDLSHGRHQVLVHPVWWQGERRLTVCVHPRSTSVDRFTALIHRATSTRAATFTTIVENDAVPEGAVQDGARTDIASIDRSEHMRRLRRWLIRQRRPQQGDALLAIPSDERMLAVIRREAPDAFIVSVAKAGVDEPATAAFSAASIDLPGDDAALVACVRALGFLVHPLMLDPEEVADHAPASVRWFLPAPAPTGDLVATLGDGSRPALSEAQLRARYDQGLIFIRLRRGQTRGELVFGAGSTSRLKEGGGHALDAESIYRCHVGAGVPPEGSLRAFINFYDDDGHRTSREELGALTPEAPTLAAKFMADPGAAWFTLSLHYSPASPRDVAVIRAVDIDSARSTATPPGAFASFAVRPQLALHR